MLSHLGFAAGDRVAILHMDDVGLCQATLPAFKELAGRGAISSASVMVPCPWFAAAAALCSELPGADLGIHLTLTCEWDAYRWGPLSTREPGTGLAEADGGFPRSREAVAEQGNPEAVDREMRAQLALAQAAGIDVTHLDCHMFAALHPRLLPLYVRLGLEHSLPVLLWRDHPALREIGPETVEEWRQRGAFAVDHVAGLRLSEPGDRKEQLRRIVRELQPGLTHVIVHPAVDTPELRALAADWRSRAGDLEALLDPELGTLMEKEGVRRIGYRQVRDALRP